MGGPDLGVGGRGSEVRMRSGRERRNCPGTEKALGAARERVRGEWTDGRRVGARCRGRRGQRGSRARPVSPPQPGFHRRRPAPSTQPSCPLQMRPETSCLPWLPRPVPGQGRAAGSFGDASVGTVWGGLARGHRSLAHSLSHGAGGAEGRPW